MTDELADALPPDDAPELELPADPDVDDSLPTDVRTETPTAATEENA